MKPDDDLSKKIEQELGSDIYYMGHEYSDSFGMCYKFLLNTKETETISAFSDIINQCVIGKKEKISIYVYFEVLNAVETVFCIYNYTNKDCDEADLKNGVFLYLSENRRIDDQFFLNPMTYTVIKNVEILSVTSEMNEKIEGKIDLHEYWPDLEKTIVR